MSSFSDKNYIHARGQSMFSVLCTFSWIFSISSDHLYHKWAVLPVHYYLRLMVDVTEMLKLALCYFLFWCLLKMKYLWCWSMLYTNAIIYFLWIFNWPLFFLLLPHIANLIGAKDLTNLLLTSSHLLLSMCVTCSM